MLTPVGAPILAELARKSPSRDPNTDAFARRRALFRRQAVWALASLGNNLQRFPELAENQRSETLSALRQASGGTGESADWARRALAFLENSGPLGAIDGLISCASADDPFLREQTAHALSFWFGTADENRRAEAALLVLARDDGHGTTVDTTKDD